jgi:hypothetical protein
MLLSAANDHKLPTVYFIERIEYSKLDELNRYDCRIDYCGYRAFWKEMRSNIKMDCQMWGRLLSWKESLGSLHVSEPEVFSPRNAVGLGTPRAAGVGTFVQQA